MLVITQYIAKHELNPLSRFLKIDDILNGAQKVTKGLAIQTKSPENYKKFKFFKVRIGKKNFVRMIAFVLTENKKVVPILIRLKKDKIFGMNMAMNNPEVVKQINKNLDFIIEDIQEKRYEEFQY